jgi:carbon monoxide dehydrogenase subunit G
VTLSTIFEVAVPLPRVFAFLCDPRNLITANHDGPVVEQSTGPFGVGSWFVLAFDQIRARVEYTAFEPTRRLAVSVVMSGRGAGGMSSKQEFVLTALDGGSGTRIEATADGTGGWIRWGPIVRASQAATWRRLSKRIEASA